MDPQIRQVRKSCETCRTRKLRCSGDKTGCTRCKALSIPCRFKNKGAPGRPRKRLRPEQPEIRRERTSSSSSHFSSIPDMPLSDDAILLGAELDSFSCGIAGNCGFDALPRMENGCSFPELWQMARPELGIPVSHAVPDLPTPMGSYASISQCKCDEEVSGLARSLNRVDMGHGVISTLRIGVSLAERLLTCPVCYDVSKPPRVTVQNVLLIGHLMLEVTSGYQRYLKWLNGEKDGAERETETVYLDSGMGFPSELNLQISGEKFRDLVAHGLQADVERLLMLGENFADRQRRRHMVGHEACADNDGRCRRQEFGVDHDPLDVCPHNPVARKLIPCFRIVDEVQEMVRQVAGALV